jgi:predicted deacylase
VLALVAGTHGSEYVPIIALQTAAHRDRSGDATRHGDHGARRQHALVSRPHGVLLAGRRPESESRVPGKADGTLSERIAYAITNEVINRATHVADLHGGDGNESLRPYSYWITTGDPKVAEQSRAMAIAFGLDHIVVDHGRPTDPAKSSFLSNTAITRGKPASRPRMAIVRRSTRNRSRWSSAASPAC